MVALRCPGFQLLPRLLWSLLFLTFILIFAKVSGVASGLGEARAQTVGEPEVQVSLKGGVPAFQSNEYGTPRNKLFLDLYQALSRELAIPIEIEVYPYARTLEYLKTGEIDLAILFKNPGLKDYVEYVGKLSQSKVVVISRKGLPVKEYEDLYNLKNIAVIRKASYEPRFDKDQKLAKFKVENYRQGLLMLQSNRVDAIAGSFIALQFATDQIGADISAWEDPFVLGTKEAWVHFSNRSEHKSVVPALRKAVKKLYNPDLFSKLLGQQSEISN